jgi:hypothetical protein
MRWLIGVYLALGATQLVLSGAIGALGVRSLLTGAPRRGSSTSGEEALLIAVIGALAACVPLLAAYGLWRRWRMVRLTLLVLSWWSLGCSALAAAGAGATWAGVMEGRELGFNEPPTETLVTAFGLAAFSGWQAWVLLGPRVRRSFCPTPNEALHLTAAASGDSGVQRLAVRRGR